MIELVEELKKVMEEKKISAETAALFIGVSGRQIRRWLDGSFIPNVESRRAMRRGIRKIRRLL